MTEKLELELKNGNYEMEDQIIMSQTTSIWSKISQNWKILGKILLCCFFATALTILFIRIHQLQNIIKLNDDKIKDMKKHIDECDHASFSPCSNGSCIDHPDGYECKCKPGM